MPKALAVFLCGTTESIVKSASSFLLGLVLGAAVVALGGRLAERLQEPSTESLLDEMDEHALALEERTQEILATAK